MPAAHMTFVGEGDGAWPDLKDKGDDVFTHFKGPVQVAGLENGMQSGKPSVSVRVDLDDGRIVVFETSLAMFLTIADAMKARFGDPRD